ncbi:MAG: methionyl-tRNA formyltransferase, partial [bacterium]|nr:methionyl-tRNA formyltransferase [bacterium]
MRIAFLGTPAFAVPSLNRVVEAGYDVVAVVTQPDRPKGRGKKLASPGVKVRAIELGLAVHQPPKVNPPEVVEWF